MSSDTLPTQKVMVDGDFPGLASSNAMTSTCLHTLSRQQMLCKGQSGESCKLFCFCIIMCYLCDSVVILLCCCVACKAWVRSCCFSCNILMIWKTGFNMLQARGQMTRRCESMGRSAGDWRARTTVVITTHQHGKQLFL